MAGPALAAPFFTSSPAPLAPALDSSFAGLGNPPHGQDVVPPDTMGAVGPNHLVSLLNSDFGVFNKTTGAVLQQISLQSFWASLGTAAGQPADFPFDTKVLYDTSSARFYAVTLGGTSAPNSWILVAVSASSDPTGAWSKWAIDADLDNKTQQFDNWADFPGVGLDSNNLYVCANMFSNSDAFQYGKIWVLPKPQLLSGSSSITWSEFRDPPGSSFSMQPAHTFGAAPAEYFLFEGSSSQLLMARIDNSSGTPVWHAPTAVTDRAIYRLELPAGRPPVGQRQHDRHVGHPPPERGLSGRFSLDRPDGAKPEHGQDGSRLVPDRPRFVHGSLPRADQRPDPLVLLPLHRGQQG